MFPPSNASSFFTTHKLVLVLIPPPLPLPPSTTLVGVAGFGEGLGGFEESSGWQKKKVIVQCHRMRARVAALWFAKWYGAVRTPSMQGRRGSIVSASNGEARAAAETRAAESCRRHRVGGRRRHRRHRRVLLST